MPFPELKVPYYELQNSYRELTPFPKDFEMNPIQIVNIRGLGKITQLQFFLRSNAGKLVEIELKNKGIQEIRKKEKAGFYFKKIPFEPFVLTEATIKEKLKTGLVVLKNMSENTHALYTSAPSDYAGLRGLYIDQLYAKREQTDSIALESKSRESYGFILNDPLHISSTFLDISDGAYTSVSGNIVVEFTEYETETYGIDELPKEYIFNKENNSLHFPLEYSYGKKILGFNSTALKEAIPFENAEPTQEMTSSIYFETQPKVIAIRKAIGRKMTTVPIQLEIPKGNR